MKKAPKKITGNARIKLGINRETKEVVYLTKSKWDCGWYWSFGYVGNNRCHYHLESYQNKDQLFKDSEGQFHHFTEKRNINMYDALLADYKLEPHIERNLWTFCELAKTIYQLKATAELAHIGGAHFTSNPCQNLLKDPVLEHKINYEVLPKVIQEFWDLCMEVDRYQSVTAAHWEESAKAFCR